MNTKEGFINNPRATAEFEAIASAPKTVLDKRQLVSPNILTTSIVTANILNNGEQPIMSQKEKDDFEYGLTHQALYNPLNWIRKRIPEFGIDQVGIIMNEMLNFSTMPEEKKPTVSQDGTIEMKDQRALIRYQQWLVSLVSATGITDKNHQIKFCIGWNTNILKLFPEDEESLYSIDEEKIDHLKETLTKVEELLEKLGTPPSSDNQSTETKRYLTNNILPDIPARISDQKPHINFLTHNGPLNNSNLASPEDNDARSPKLRTKLNRDKTTAQWLTNSIRTQGVSKNIQTQEILATIMIQLDHLKINIKELELHGYLPTSLKELLDAVKPEKLQE